MVTRNLLHTSPFDHKKVSTIETSVQKVVQTCSQFVLHVFEVLGEYISDNIYEHNIAEKYVNY